MSCKLLHPRDVNAALAVGVWRAAMMDFKDFVPPVLPADSRRAAWAAGPAGICWDGKLIDAT